MKFLKYLIISLFLFTQISTFATENQYKNVFSLDWQNDIGFSDRYYTDAIKLSYTNKDKDWYATYLQFEFLDLFLDFDNKTFFQSVSIGQDMYVGYDIENATPPLDDRPYSGFLYTTFTAHAMGENTLDSFSITLGLTGKYSLAEDAQKFVHSIIDSPEPMGWDNQVGTHFGFVLTYQHARRLYTYKLSENFSMDLTGMGQVNLGNVLIDGSLKAMFRFGFNLPNSYDFVNIDYANAKDVGIAENGDDWHAYIFVGAKASAVAYDISLDGSTYNVDYDIEKEYITGSAYFGFSTRYDCFQIDYSFIIASDTFKTQKGGLDYMSIISFKYLR
ncbi:MAG: lipid A deacylase LpxR family protein [Opitutales bacterium]